MSVRDIAAIQVGPQPLFAWLGLLTFLLLLMMASYAYALINGKGRSIPVHKALAALTLVFGGHTYDIGLDPRRFNEY